MALPTTANFKTVMAADTGAGGVNTLLTGGIYTLESTNGYGIGPENSPGAFNTTTHLLKPCALVKLRDAVPDGQINDDVLQQVSVRQICEIWLYDERVSGFVTTTAVRARLFLLFHGVRVPASSGEVVRYYREVTQQFAQEQFGKMCIERVDLEIRGVKS